MVPFGDGAGTAGLGRYGSLGRHEIKDTEPRHFARNIDIVLLSKQAADYRICLQLDAQEQGIQFTV